MPSAFSMPPMRCSSPAVPGHRPRPGERLRVAQVGPERRVAAVRRAVCVGARSRTRPAGPAGRSTVGDPPRLGAVGQVAVGEQDHRHAVRRGDPRRLQRGVEAVGGRPRRHDRHRRLAVAAEHRLQQVGLLGLGRHARSRGRRAARRRRSAAARGTPPSPIVSALSARPGPEVEVTASDPPYAAPSAAPTAAISSSAWKVRTPNRLCLDSSCRMSEAGVIGYEPRNSGSPLRCEAATRP